MSFNVHERAFNHTYQKVETVGRDEGYQCPSIEIYVSSFSIDELDREVEGNQVSLNDAFIGHDLNVLASVRAFMHPQSLKYN